MRSMRLQFHIIAAKSFTILKIDDIIIKNQHFFMSVSFTFHFLHDILTVSKFKKQRRNKK